MKMLKVAAMAVVLTLGTAVAQETEQQVELKVKVIKEGGEAHDVHWVSGGMDFELDDLAVGETRTMTGDDGQTVTVTRTDTGMEFVVDGETVVVPNIGESGQFMTMIDGDVDVEVHALHGDAENVDVEVVGVGTHATRAFSPEGVTIISGEPLDASVRESIRSVLISAGHDDEVTFIDGSGEKRQVKVIKRVESL